MYSILDSTEALKMEYQRVYIDKDKILEHPN